MVVELVSTTLGGLVRVVNANACGRRLPVYQQAIMTRYRRARAGQVFHNPGIVVALNGQGDLRTRSLHMRAEENGSR